MMVDSTVWRDHLRNIRTRQVDYLRHAIRMRTDPPRVGDLVLFEVLQSSAQADEAKQIAVILRSFGVEPMVGADIAYLAADLDRTMRLDGIIVRKPINLLIGAYCIKTGYRLLHDQRDFDHMEKAVGLLVQATDLQGSSR